MTSMDAIARGWLIAVVKDQYWRVASWYDFDDLVQDGYMVWYRVVQKYEVEAGRVRSRPHLMRLFKRSFINHIHQLAKNKTVASFEIKAADLITFADPWSVLAPAFDVGEYARVVVDAPKAVRPLLRRLLFGAPSPVLRARPRFRADGTRTTTNERMCRLVGADPASVDLADELYSYLRS